ncbi:hypothetical protein [Variovorax sp. GrIS 2.14]|uniref:hypothetical protein n=1 Tax=Variovorax sp. GrIS 2.14 TaxID=3071709 RepID=UPI0038F66D05
MAIAERARQLMQMAGLPLTHPAEPSLREAPAATHELPLPFDAATWLRSNNVSGIAGVQRRVNATTLAATWLAQTRIFATLTLRRSFSVQRYGEAESRALAIAERAVHLPLKCDAAAALVK